MAYSLFGNTTNAHSEDYSSGMRRFETCIDFIATDSRRSEEQTQQRST